MMKRLIPVLALTLFLGGCAGEMSKIKDFISVVTETTVTPKIALVIANSFDAMKAGATGYLVYCKGNLDKPACSADNRRTVIKYVRKGTPIRDQIEGYISTQTSVPRAVYNLMEDVITNLKTTPAAGGYGATQ